MRAAAEKSGRDAIRPKDTQKNSWYSINGMTEWIVRTTSPGNSPRNTQIPPGRSQTTPGSGSTGGGCETHNIVELEVVEVVHERGLELEAHHVDDPSGGRECAQVQDRVDVVLHDHATIEPRG